MPKITIELSTEEWAGASLDVSSALQQSMIGRFNPSPMPGPSIPPELRQFAAMLNLPADVAERIGKQLMSLTPDQHAAINEKVKTLTAEFMPHMSKAIDVLDEMFAIAGLDSFRVQMRAVNIDVDKALAGFAAPEPEQTGA